MYILGVLDNHYSVFPKLSVEEYSELRAGFPELPVDKPEWLGDRTLLITDDNKHLLVKYGLAFKIAETTESKSLGQMLVKLQDRMEALEGKAKDHRFNLARLEAAGAVVQIHIPDLGLLYIREVQVLEDCCTDILQRELNEGWRILAVCPPNAQRRPDYILGRTKQND